MEKSSNNQQQQQQHPKTQTNKPKCIRNLYFIFLFLRFVEIKYIINHKLHLQGLS